MLSQAEGFRLFGHSTLELIDVYGRHFLDFFIFVAVDLDSFGPVDGHLSDLVRLLAFDSAGDKLANGLLLSLVEALLQSFKILLGNVVLLEMGLTLEFLEELFP